MSAPKYVLSFSAGGLLYHESITVADVVVRADFDWPRAKEAITSENLLQSRTASTATRKLREVVKRLQLLTRKQVTRLANGGRQEQKLILWLACCLRYKLVADFAREVVRSKFLELDLSIEASDVERFIEHQTVWHEEIENLTESTRTKLQTVILRMLRETEMLSADGLLTPPACSREFIAVIIQGSRDHLLFFPIAEPR